MQHLVRRLAVICGAAFILLLAPPASAAGKLGIVLMHGLQGRPDRGIADLAFTLDAAGYLVERPEMCWSRFRVYDLPYLDCARDVDAAVARLKERGAAGIVIAGMSQGGSYAIAYGARHQGLKGIIALAPAPPVDRMAHRPEIRQSLEKAKAMIAAGKADESDTFTSFNLGAPFSVKTTAAIYVSFLAADSPGFMPANTPKLTAPLLWVAGDSDRSQLGPDYAFAKAPSHPLNRYVTVRSDHLGTPNAGRDAVLAWLKTLAAE